MITRARCFMGCRTSTPTARCRGTPGIARTLSRYIGPWSKLSRNRLSTDRNARHAAACSSNGRRPTICACPVAAPATAMTMRLPNPYSLLRKMRCVALNRSSQGPIQGMWWSSSSNPTATGAVPVLSSAACYRAGSWTISSGGRQPNRKTFRLRPRTSRSHVRNLDTGHARLPRRGGRGRPCHRCSPPSSGNATRSWSGSCTTSPATRWVASALRPAGFPGMRSPMPWRTWTSPTPIT